MATLRDLREGLERTWGQLAEGWRELWDRAANALTRFRPRQSGADLEPAEEQVMMRSSRWGVLAAEVREDDDNVIVRIEVPGMDKDHFDLVVDNDTLVVRGEKRVEREQQRGHYHLLECAYGSFERAVVLPAPVDEEGARATYRKGVLEVTLPKSAAARRRVIQVK